VTPKDRKYAESHEWVKVEGDTAIVGISDYAQHELGDITFVEVPRLGEAFEKGDECAVVESVKAASDIYAPVSGTVVDVNDALADSPESVNDDPYDAGWIFKLKDVNADEIESLMDAADYVAMVSSHE